jgi:thioredoxin 1
MNIITTEQFKNYTQPTAGKQIVMFSAAWCGPCKVLTPVLDSIAASSEDVTISKVDIEQEQDLTVSLGISGVPTLLFYNNGELKHKHVGATSASRMKELIEKHL